MTFKVGPLAGAVFGVYTAETIKVIPKNTLVDILTTDENGVATSVTTLPFGKYYLKELKVSDETIHLIEESFPVTVAGANKQYFNNPIENERFKGNIAIWKEDDSNPGRMLGGAQYEIRDKDGLFYRTMTTDKDGYALYAFPAMQESNTTWTFEIDDDEMYLKNNSAGQIPYFAAAGFSFAGFVIQYKKRAYEGEQRHAISGSQRADDRPLGRGRMGMGRPRRPRNMAARSAGAMERLADAD